MNLNKSDFRYDIAILRLLAIVVVVAFHGYGMTMVHFSESTNALYNDTYYWFNQAGLINIAMPLFVWISGYLYFREIGITARSIKTLAVKKSRRIIIPYLLFTLLFMLTTNTFDIRPFYQGGYWHLWFLPMLAWCFVAGWCLKGVVRGECVWAQIGIQIGLFALIFLPIALPRIFGLYNLKNWFCWFYGGMLTCRYDGQIMRFLQKTHAVWILVILCVALMCFSPTLYENYTVQKLVSSSCGILAVWYICRRIPWENYRFTDFLLLLSGLSFGIYIFHNWVEMCLMSRTMQRVLPIETFAVQHPYAFPILFCAIAFVISAILTLMIRSTKHGKKLI